MLKTSGTALRLSYTVAKLLIAFSLCFCPFYANAQGLVDQETIRPIVENQIGDIDNVKQVTWRVHTIKSNGKQSSSIRQGLTACLDSIAGQYDLKNKIQIIELANRTRMAYIKGGKKIIVPDHFPADYRAYAPYPFFYDAAKNLAKLFIIDKYTQTFGAYENGRLVHWGLVSCGRSNSSTPSGRYNFNWRTYYKLSNAAPEGELWHLYWVFNFYSKIGLHVHQYHLPINRAASHGCVRTARPDAEWNYKWANGWVDAQNGNPARNGTPVLIINNNPPGNVAAHWAITKDDTVQSLVRLPEDLYQYPLVEKRGAPWESGR
jgi:hypothetical protein